MSRVADEGLDLVLLHELLGRLGRDAHVVLAVVDDELERPPEHATRGVDLLDRELGARWRRARPASDIAAGDAEATADRHGSPVADGLWARVAPDARVPRTTCSRDRQCADTSLHAAFSLHGR